MPMQTYLFLLTAVIAGAGATVALAYAQDLNFLWLGLAALTLAFVIRRIR